ncbi:MAG: hypothetical protein KBH93_04230 [Anaerolineae bacterium]|nr:hypothetical protein [Anaerolineae bacterium]
MSTIYATLDGARRYLGLAADQTGDDDLLLVLLGAASRLIEGYAGRRFYPQRATRRYTASDPFRLLLGADLLALHSLTNGDGSAIPLDAVHLEPANEAVSACLLLDRTRAAFVHGGDPLGAIAVEGTWGYHPAWADAWQDSGDGVQDDPLAADAVTLTVSDATGAGFAVGQLLRIGEEYLHLLAVDALTDTLAVARGANGTAAASHAQGAAIAIYTPPEDVRQACLRVTHWLYKQPDAGFVQRTGGLRGEVIVPPALPDDVRQILEPLVRVRVA